ncbi:hypothetical protein KIW84_021304 [Lathyrus oleraceus]|uniref:Uncharacterized protein n=1 Tax=Pisum sativum TaxID=3888 RepID=A0A9D5B3S6_PEA|nr:hypothetical protein KIW84_021304 [Pisum sativum]
MLHYVICHVLLPKDSNLSQINDLEMQVLFAVKNKIRINWLPTMMYHLKQQLSLKIRLPYGRLISRILELTDMEIGREPFLAMTPTTNEINGVTIMKNTGIIQCNDGSYKYDDGSSSSNFPIPEGGLTNEFLYTTMMSQHRETTRAIKSLRNLVLSSRNLPMEDDEGEAGSEAEGEENEDSHKKIKALCFIYVLVIFPRDAVVSGQRTSRILCYAKNLSVDDRMLHYVICHVLLPKDSNLSQINDLEMQVLFAVKNKIRINWLPTMMYHLKQQLSLKIRLPYGRLISRILELTDMEIGREPFLAMTPTTNEINGVTIMKNTGIIQCNDGSYKYDDGSSSSNFPIPEGGLTNEFLYTTMMSQHRETTRAIKSLRNLVLSSRNLPMEDDEGEAGSEAEGEENEDSS